MIIIDVSNGFYEDSSKPISSQRCVNLIPHVPDVPSRMRGVLKAAEGLSQFSVNGIKVCRGAITANGVPYFVNGNELYKVDEFGVSSRVGSLDIDGSSRVSMACSNKEISIVVNELGHNKVYIVDQSTGVITDVTASLPSATNIDFVPKKVVYKDGYFVYVSNDKFFISDINQGTVFQSLDFGAAESDPDFNVTIHADGSNLYVAGSKTIQLFQNVGGTGFPFASIGSIPKGVASVHGICSFDNSFVWLGGGHNEYPAIWRYSGNGAVKISTSAIDEFIGDHSLSSLQSVFTTTYARDGSYFVSFHFNDAVFTYDAASSAKKGASVWFERESRNESGRSIPWRVNEIVTAYGKLLVGDRLGPKIGRLSLSYNQEYGGIIDRDFTTSHIGDGQSFQIHELELDCETGIGGSSDPLVTMAMSTDGGRTYSDERSLSMGKSGQYTHNPTWRRLGLVHRLATFKFSISGAVNPVINRVILKAVGAS